jgi:hypothetical protein
MLECVGNDLPLTEPLPIEVRLLLRHFFFDAWMYAELCVQHLNKCLDSLEWTETRINERLPQSLVDRLAS